MKLRLALFTALFALVGLSSTANAEAINYIIDTDASTASVTITYNGSSIIGSGGELDVTGSFITWDADTLTLSDLEIKGGSVDTIMLNQSLNLGVGTVSTVFVDSATLVDGSDLEDVFKTTVFPETFAVTGGVDVTSSLTTDLGPTAFDFSASSTLFNVAVTDNGDGSLSLQTSGFTFARFDVYDGSGNVIGQVVMTADLDLLAVAAVPEPSAAVLYLLSFVVATPFFKRS